jgi:hypothetical protein
MPGIAAHYTTCCPGGATPVPVIDPVDGDGGLRMPAADRRAAGTEGGP